MRYFRELVGEEPGKDLAACDTFAKLLWDHVERHPVHEETDDEGEYFNEQFTIKSIEAGKLVLEGLLEDDADIVLSLPSAVLRKARLGWSITMEITRIKGRWRILSVGNVYP